MCLSNKYMENNVNILYNNRTIEFMYVFINKTKYTVI